MDIKRRGSNRDSGYVIAFKGKKPTLKFEEESGSVILEIHRTSGMGAQGEYDYSVSLSSEDLSQLFQFVADQRAAFQDGPLQKQLKSASHALLRLLLGSAALPNQLLPTEMALKLQAARVNIAKPSVQVGSQKSNQNDDWKDHAAHDRRST